MIKRLFFSWQSDSPAEKAFVRKCLQEVCDELDVEYDEDTRNSGAAEFVADVLLRKIRNSSVFVADLTPVGESSNGKKLANPNVCFETGFTECHHSRQQIILTFNEGKATFDDLPFDLSKRVSIRFRLSATSDIQRTKLYKKQLKQAILTALKTQHTREQPKTSGPQLNRSEKTLLYWGSKVGNGYVSNVLPFKDLGNEALIPGRRDLRRPGPFTAFAAMQDIKPYSLYEKALWTLKAKHLITKSSSSSEHGIWIITEDGEAQAERLAEDDVHALITYTAYVGN